MESSTVILMQAGIGVIGDIPGDYSIDVFNGAELKPSADGLSVRIEGAGANDFIDLPLAAVGHLLTTEAEVFLYSTEVQDGVATYRGSVLLNRDLLIEANTWCKAFKQLGGDNMAGLSAANS